MKLQNLVQTLQILTLLEQPQLQMSATNGNVIPTIKLIFNNEIEPSVEYPDLITIVTDKNFSIVDVLTSDVIFMEQEADLGQEMNTVAWVVDKACFHNTITIIGVFHAIKTKTIKDRVLLPGNGIAYVDNNYSMSFNEDVFVAALIHHSFNDTLKFKGDNLHLGDWIIPDWFNWYNGSNTSLPRNSKMIAIGEDMYGDLLS